MASSIPTFQTLISVEKFRELINKHFENEINNGEYDPRDLQRFVEIDSYTLMFIQHGQFGASFDEERAFRIFHNSMSWRKKHNVYDISPDDFPEDYFDRHAIYFKNHDMSNNPLLHFVVRTFNKGQEDNEAVKRFIIYTYERHIRRYPGQKIVLLFDLSSCGLSNLDYDLVKFIIACGQTFYPGLLAYMLIYKMPIVLQTAWKIIRTWLPTEAEQFIKFVDAKSITQYIRDDQLSTAMGGTDTSNYVHIHDSVNDSVEDPMNAISRKKVTFADNGLLDLPLSSASGEAGLTTENNLKNDFSPNDDVVTPEEPMSSVSTPDLSHSITRKSILQKSPAVNGINGDEKVIHGLSIKPYDEMVFERSDSPSQTSADSIQTINLINTSDKILTFKIKTTSPDKFRVKPGCSLLHPGASATVSVYLLKAYCTPASNINKEKFLIIWTYIGQELKQAQLVDFWKTVPTAVLYEHRLKCTLSTKPTLTVVKPPPIEPAPVRSITNNSPDPSMSEMKKLLKDSLTLQESTLAQTSVELRNIRFLLLIIFALLILILLWDIFKYLFSSTSSSVKTDL